MATAIIPLQNIAPPPPPASAPPPGNTLSQTLFVPGPALAPTTTSSQSVTHPVIQHGAGGASGTTVASAVVAAPNVSIRGNSASNILALPSSAIAGLHQRWDKFWNATNGIGIAALVLALVFGTGAWVGMNMQYTQGAKSLELTIWTTCADHENIQDTALCRQVLSKDFDQFQARDVRSVSNNIGTVKREIVIDILTEDAIEALPKSRIEKFLGGLSDTERALVIGGNRPGRYEPIPEIRAMLFPFAHVLYTPFRWFFSLIESLLLTTVYVIHRVFGWVTAAAWFCFQLWVYSVIENIVKVFCQNLDLALMEMLPDWASKISISGITGTVAMSALKSYWYGVSFIYSMKWMVIYRVGFWCTLQVIRLLALSYAAWQNKVKRRD